MSKLEEYDGQRAPVTGAFSGIGRLLVLRLAEKGARVALVANIVRTLFPGLMCRQVKRYTIGPVTRRPCSS